MVNKIQFFMVLRVKIGKYKNKKIVMIFSL